MWPLPSFPTNFGTKQPKSQRLVYLEARKTNLFVGMQTADLESFIFIRFERVLEEMFTFQKLQYLRKAMFWKG